MNESAGLLMYVAGDPLKVLLAHPGGPYWTGKDLGVWTIPKGLPASGEDLLAAAQREFFEETGIRPSPPFLPLSPIRQKAGKLVHAWAFAGDAAPATAGASMFEIEWPPKSGLRQRFRRSALVYARRSARADFARAGPFSRRTRPPHHRSGLELDDIIFQGLAIALCRVFVPKPVQDAEGDCQPQSQYPSEVPH